MLPDLAAHQRQGITEGWLSLVVPGRLPDGQLATFGVLMSNERHEREQRQQGGCGPHATQLPGPTTGVGSPRPSVRALRAG